MNTYSFSVDGRYIFDFSMANDQVSHRLLDTFVKKDREILDYLTPDRIVSNGHWNCFYPSILQDNSDLLAKKRRNRFVVPLQYHREQEKERISYLRVRHQALPPGTGSESWTKTGMNTGEELILGASPAERTTGRRRQPCSKAGYCWRNAERSADCCRDAPPLQGVRSRQGRGQDTKSMGEMLRWSLVVVAQLLVAAVVGNGCAISFFSEWRRREQGSWRLLG